VSLPEVEPIHLSRVEAIALSVPLATPLPASFGAMDARSTLLVRLEDREGAVGWGEIWCNFPTFGNLHKARLAERIVGPLLLETPARPGVVGAALERRLHALALQTGEFGPIAQVIGGLDMALWDLAARRACVPLRVLLGATADDVPAYASAINPTGTVETVRAARAAGHRAFKVKVGFGRERDLRNVADVTDDLRAGEALMVDANQAWDATTAREFAGHLSRSGVAWVEEPLPADAPHDDWRTVADAGCPVAAGENMRGGAAFDDALAAGWLAVAQPDAGKWGGVSGIVSVGRKARAAGRRFCPHHLGGAIGLVAAAHALAAVGGDGLLEMDVNDNALRTALAGPLPAVVEGRWPLPSGPGLGVEPDLEAVAEWIRPAA